MVVVYSKNPCGQCDLTKMLLERNGIPFEVRDISKDEAALAEIKSLNYLQVPVVLLPSGEHWSGFRPDLIKAI